MPVAPFVSPRSPLCPHRGHGRIARFLIAAIAAAAFLLAECGFAQEQRLRVEVDSRAGWTDAGIDLLPGDRLTLAARGEWTNGGANPTFTGPGGFGDLRLPDAELPTAPFAGLIGRIDDEPFFVGREYSTTVQSAGRLLLAMNDVHGTFGDNRGEVLVQIRLVSHPVPMPDLTGQTFEQASGFLRERYHRTAKPQDGYSRRPVGEVFSQTPKPGEDLRGVPEIVLDVSLGPQLPREETPAPPSEETPPPPGESSLQTQPPLVESPPAPIRVPDVIGDLRLDAIRSLRTHGLQAVSREYEPSRLARDRVTRTDPPAESEVARGTLVGFWLASGGNRIPPLAGQPAATAEDRLAEEGFSRGAIAHEINVTAIGRVLASDPPAGTIVPLGTEVALTIGRDPPLMPDITQKPLEEARRTLAELDANLDIAIERKLRWASPDRVLAQSPIEGTPLAPNQRVTLGVSLSLGWIWAIAVGFLGAGATAGRLLLWPPSIKPSLVPEIKASFRLDLAESVPAISLDVELLPGDVDSEISVPVVREE